MRLWVMENGLIDETGHHFNNSLGLRQACLQRGIETRFLVHRNAPPAVTEALQARAIFRHTPYEEVSKDPLAGAIESFFIQANAFAEGFDAAVANGLGPDGLVFVPTTMQHELHGCALAFSRLAPERRPRLILNFMIENFLVPGTLNLGWHARLYRFAIRGLARVIPAKDLLLTANGRRMAGFLGTVLAQPVAEYPMPKHYPSGAADMAGPVSPQQPARVAILGHSLPAKGFNLVPALVAANPQWRWLVQVAPAGQDVLWQDAREAMYAAPNVEIASGSLDPAAYYALLSRADVVLLPYDATQLPLRSSGIFSEAVAAGKVVVVPQGSWMADHLAAGNGSGTVFANQTAASISNALGQACERLQELKAHALAAAPLWRSWQCIDAYLDRALDALAIKPPEHRPQT